VASLGTALSFDDVSIIPAYSDLDSRDEVDLTSNVGFATLKVPLISSPMDTVSGIVMLLAMDECGASGVHHRYCDPLSLLPVAVKYPIAVSPSMGVDLIRKLVAEYNPHPVLVLDIAHGHSRKALEYACACVELGAIVISGNIVTPEAAIDYHNIGVNIFRVGVGNGSACSTRVVAAAGVPQFTAIQDIYNEFPTITENGISRKYIHIISDGGCHDSGDCVKAFAAGADAVMSGRLFASADQAPGDRTSKKIDDKWLKLKEYSGMSSEIALDRGGKEKNIEGVSSWIPCEGPVSGIIDRLVRGMKAGLAYTGSRTISELRKNAQFVQVTHNGLIEGRPRI
jgi:IMP dehydrogenase